MLLDSEQSGAQRAFIPDVDLALRATIGEAQILPGFATRVWKFTGELIRGPAETIQVDSGGYLGPVIGLRKGQKVRVRFSNTLTEPTIVHWHGLDLPAKMDGHPRWAIAPGEDFIYEFEVINRAGTYWYHPHPDRLTGPQVYRGLAGLLLIAVEHEDMGMMRNFRVTSVA
jgi:hypothetical protein